MSSPCFPQFLHTPHKHLSPHTASKQHRFDSLRRSRFRKKLLSRQVASYSAALMLGTLVTAEDPAASLMSTMGFHITQMTIDGLKSSYDRRCQCSHDSRTSYEGREGRTRPYRIYRTCRKRRKLIPTPMKVYDNTGPLHVPEVPYDSSQEVPDYPWPPAPDGFENYGDAVKADKQTRCMIPRKVRMRPQ
ncbi:hypothetical protein HBI80_160410 [Parastagonospora nodorum]|nr:hypothetical protein HBI80_160410 [Parastagonospora nodorum]KAH5436450.1 hypothetical protein HBI47_073360 [Parastagonospora nodorum]